MKAIHVPFCFYPDSIGGTEVYVGALVRCLRAYGVQGIVAAPGKEDAKYTHEDLLVRRFSITQDPDLATLYGEGDSKAAQMFGRILDEEDPDLIHLHAFTAAVSVLLVREAKKRGIPVVFTYHTATASCQRGTLMRWGKETCDGVLRLGVCARCTLNGLGLPRGVADLAGSVPVVAGKYIGSMRLSGAMWTALRMRELTSMRHAAFQSLMREVDHVVAVSQWVQELLVHNGVPVEKITFCRHGLDLNREKRGGDNPTPLAEGPLRVVFLGRLGPYKGLHIVLEVLRQDPALSVRLDIYGMVQGPEEARHFQYSKALAAGDDRVRFHEEIPPSEVAGILKRYELLIVPSQWMETGPMVVLEAFGAGLPVLASRLGGISELVEHGINGLLVEHRSVRAWREALKKLSCDRALLERLREGIRVPRTMDQVAREMERLYRRLKESG